MFRITRPSCQLALATAIGIVSLVGATPVRAQISGSYTYDAARFAYFVNGDTTVSGDLGNTDIFVGKDNATNFATLAGPYTLTVTGAFDGSSGTKINGHGDYYPIGDPNATAFAGVDIFGASTANISGGFVAFARGFDTSTINVSGGKMNYAEARGNGAVNLSNGNVLFTSAYNNATTTVTGGILQQADGYDNSTVNIFGGMVDFVNAHDNSTANVANTTARTAMAQGNGIVNIGWNNTFELVLSYDDSTVNISGSTFSNAILPRGTSTLNLAGNFTVHSENTYAYFNGAYNYLLKDYMVVGNFNDGTQFNKTITAAASGASFGAGNVQLRGDYFDVAPDLFVTANDSVNNIYNTVTVGRSSDSLVSTSPTVSLSAGTNTVYANIYNNSQVTVNGAIVQQAITANDTSTVTLSDGTVGYVDARGNSTVNFSDDAIFGLYGNENSVINITDGDINQIFNRNNSTTNLIGGIVVSFVGVADSRLNVSGGNMTYLAGYNNCLITMSGGNATNLEGSGNAVINLSGGSVTHIFGYDSSIINVTGSAIDDNTIRMFNDATINLFGVDLSFVMNGAGSDSNGDYLEYTLFGTLLDGNSVNNVSLFDYSDAGHFTGGGTSLSFNAVTVTVPESSVLSLMTLALPVGIILNRRRKSAK